VERHINSSSSVLIGYADDDWDVKRFNIFFVISFVLKFDKRILDEIQTGISSNMMCAIPSLIWVICIFWQNYFSYLIFPSVIFYLILWIFYILETNFWIMNQSFWMDQIVITAEYSKILSQWFFFKYWYSF